MNEFGFNELGWGIYYDEHGRYSAGQILDLKKRNTLYIVNRTLVDGVKYILPPIAHKKNNKYDKHLLNNLQINIGAKQNHSYDIFLNNIFLEEVGFENNNCDSLGKNIIFSGDKKSLDLIKPEYLFIPEKQEYDYLVPLDDKDNNVYFLFDTNCDMKYYLGLKRQALKIECTAYIKNTFLSKKSTFYIRFGLVNKESTTTLIETIHFKVFYSLEEDVIKIFFKEYVTNNPKEIIIVEHPEIYSFFSLSIEICDTTIKIFIDDDYYEVNNLFLFPDVFISKNTNISYSVSQLKTLNPLSNTQFSHNISNKKYINPYIKNIFGDYSISNSNLTPFTNKPICLDGVIRITINNREIDNFDIGIYPKIFRNLFLIEKTPNGDNYYAI